MKSMEKHNTTLILAIFLIITVIQFSITILSYMILKNIMRLLKPV